VISNGYGSCVGGIVAIVQAGVIQCLWEICWWGVAIGGAVVIKYLGELCSWECSY